MTTAVADCQRRVLVVDDDADIREALAEALSDEGYYLRWRAPVEAGAAGDGAGVLGRPCA